MTSNMVDIDLCTLTDIPAGEGRPFEILGQRVAVFRSRTGSVFATQAECPHRGGPLADGLIGGNTLICPLHAWKFDLSTGDALIGECGLRTFPARVDESGKIVLSIESA
jgi:nitrite reductase (NADH) small subunit